MSTDPRLNPSLDQQIDLVLASASPRRRELLEQLGLVLSVAPADVDETPRPGEGPADYVRRVAVAKCEHVVAALAAAGDARAALPVLAADTMVVIDDDILGKPADAGEARAMLARLAGRRHEVTTAYVLAHRERRVERAVSTVVAVRALQPVEIEAYVDGGEWAGKAGGYAVQGIAGAFITELRGSHTNVIGLPLAEVLADLRALEALPRYPRPGFGRAQAEVHGAEPR